MKGISMFKIKEILRLKCEAKLSNRKIARALNMNLSLSSILKIVNNKLEKPVTITALRYHIENTKDLAKARDNFKNESLFKNQN